jgi:hypothetical protein
LEQPSTENAFSENYVVSFQPCSLMHSSKTLQIEKVVEEENAEITAIVPSEF